MKMKDRKKTLQLPLIDSSKSAVANSDDVPVHKDNRLVAIVAMNFAAICITGMTASYKLIADEYHVIELTLLRNVTGFVVACLWLSCTQQNPFKLFPWENKYTLLWRIITGQTDFFLL